ncbi:hypothetical protein ACHAWF_009776, partial [Thalassiosira exigua]
EANPSHLSAPPLSAWIPCGYDRVGSLAPDPLIGTLAIGFVSASTLRRTRLEAPLSSPTDSPKLSQVPASPSLSQQVPTKGSLTPRSDLSKIMKRNNGFEPSFVGGAEKARRNARKRMNQPRPSSSKKRRGGNKSGNASITPYPKSMRESERFFGSLLSSSPKALEQSETDDYTRRRVMGQACSLLNVPSLPTPSLLEQLAGKSSDARTHNLMQRSCSLLSTASSSSTSSSSSSGTYDNARSYYSSKAPLILEESRCIIAQSLAKALRSKSGSDLFTLELMSIDEKYPNVTCRQRKQSPLILNFQITHKPSTSNKQRSANEKSARWTRPGSVLLLRQQNDVDLSKKCVLASVVPNRNWQSQTSSNMISLMIFRRDDLNLSELSTEDSGLDDDDCDINKPVFFATALTTLIAQVRQMEACLRMVKVAFMRKLLGQKSATHIRFGDSSDEEEEDEEVVGYVDDCVHGGNAGSQEGYYLDEEGGYSSSEEDEDNGVRSDGCLACLLENIPTLNPTQEHAAKSFLDSPKESLILVQGPPGTGKSTFLVNVICRRLAANPNARLLVTAPTNRAVTVLAERFLDVIDNCESGKLLCKCNAVLVGVEDKLISHTSKTEAEYISAETLSSSLKSIFVHTWKDNLKNECLSILECLKQIHCEKSPTLDSLIGKVEKVGTKLSSSLPSQKSAFTYAKLLLRQLRATSAANAWESSNESKYSECSAYTAHVEKSISYAKDLVETLDDMDSPVQELLATARIIFCTLSTAGSSILKQTRRVDDILIDEAAAATEPEITIPFHLRPQRLLAVGDPLQLPPTIMSRHAADMGLSTSMHERLMNHCGKEFFLLALLFRQFTTTHKLSLFLSSHHTDHQYRMVPQISSYPCGQFYNGKIMNGMNVLCKTYKSNNTVAAKGPYSFVNIRGEEYQVPGGSYANEAESLAVLKLVQNISAKRLSDWHSPDKLRIVTFYAGQVNQLRRMLSKNGFGNVLVATVDSSQGCEADVVIISFVRSSSKKGVRRATGFLADDRRINVSLTRARHQLICVGNASTLGKEGSETLQRLIRDARQRNVLCQG